MAERVPLNENQTKTVDINTVARESEASLGSDHQDWDSDTDNVEMGANKVRS